MPRFQITTTGLCLPTYSWTLLDGTPLASVGNTLTIDSNTTDPTDEIVCTASASDNDGASITSSTSVLVQNTAPSVDSLSITPDTSVEANVTLEMIYSASDIDYENLRQPLRGQTHPVRCWAQDLP